MSKTPAKTEIPYVDPFLFEVGFFKAQSDREKLVEAVRRLNQRGEKHSRKAKK